MSLSNGNALKGLRTNIFIISIEKYFFYLTSLCICIFRLCCAYNFDTDTELKGEKVCFGNEAIRYTHITNNRDKSSCIA